MRRPDPNRGQRPVRTVQDLQLAAEKMSLHFSTDAIVVVGSQAILVGWPDAPEVMRTSGEIDLYPVNARQWEDRFNANAKRPEDKVEASEDIHAFFGQGSAFERQWGFYLDGVDENTAKLPPGWQERAVYREFDTHRGTLTAIAPSPLDTVVAKLHRLAEKDEEFIVAMNAVRPLDRDALLERFAACGPPEASLAKATRFLNALPGPKVDAAQGPELPECPPGSHCRFLSPDASTVTVRSWDENLKVFYKVDNPLGPAVVGPGPDEKAWFLGGRKLSEEDWAADPRVLEARPEEPQGALPPWLVPA